MGENEGERGGDEEPEDDAMLLGRWTRPPYEPKTSLERERERERDRE